MLLGKSPTFNVKGYILIYNIAASMYDLFDKSASSVGVARDVIFYELRETFPVGAVILYKGVVLAYKLLTA